MKKLLTIFFVCCLVGFLALYLRASPSLAREQLEQKVFAYPIHYAKERCKKDHGYTDEDVNLMEKELKRYFLMILLKEANDPPIGMYSKHVDDLWHSFILFTREYQHFCLSTAGYFIHHAPEMDLERSIEGFAKKKDEYRMFIETYEKIFNEEIHPIWLLDSVEKTEGTSLR